MTYVVAVAVTRVLFGAHFPLDTIAGAALGAGSAVAMRSLFARAGAVLDRAAAFRSEQFVFRRTRPRAAFQTPRFRYPR